MAVNGSDLWGYRKVRGGQQVASMDQTAVTQQPQAAQQAQQNGGFKGLSGALNPANPLLWLLLLVLLLTGLLAVSFHVRIGRADIGVEA